MATNRGLTGWRRREAPKAAVAAKAERFENRPVAPEARELLDYWRAAREAPEFIYFLTEDTDDARDVVKIGVALDPERRLAALQCGNPRQLRIAAVLLGAQISEDTLHRLWAKQRVTGEWFTDRAEIVAFALWAGERQVAAHEAAPDDKWATRPLRRWFDDWKAKAEVA